MYDMPREAGSHWNVRPPGLPCQKIPPPSRPYSLFIIHLFFLPHAPCPMHPLPLPYFLPHAPCPMPHAPCLLPPCPMPSSPMPHALCPLPPMPHALCPNPPIPKSPNSPIPKFLNSPIPEYLLDKNIALRLNSLKQTSRRISWTPRKQCSQP
ncbi:hypothetical protein Dthio_PD1487 [Desulfonatronospira thiodismutans ASO3-1]|uniref:Uncharacterized protein n=1 Tax=Desulfonatronospira thiodismutans ASO3-1 TaxID=555779 RepID=D6STX9_9BACT|nr:hypothetical protein Dthio_PD1487 [Desulfonatronospira thiodismutans ASO3-1]